MSNVKALFGDGVDIGEPNEGCVTMLEELLERAKGGDIVGLACATISAHGLASYSLAGLVGPYGLLGAVEMAKAELLDEMRDIEP
jgi:hypothetical protein